MGRWAPVGVGEIGPGSGCRGPESIGLGVWGYVGEEEGGLTVL